MSGPISRQYGVPNWDEIFGKKEEQPATPKVSKEPCDQEESRDQNEPADRTHDSNDK